MRRVILLFVVVNVLARNDTKKKTLKQFADDAFRFDRDADITWSNEQLSEDDLLKKIFPGMFE